MKQFSKDLGNVSLAPKGKWSREQEYERLALVYNACDNLSYVAKINVPSGVDIENREYWQPMNATGYADNNFINLTAENENGTITAYESLEEAVATILPINRRAGATLSFYNLNSDRLDRQAEFELWQFNSTDLANWENKDYWNNIYYNWNVFAGWYIDADALTNHVEIPNVGQYAYVGSNLNDALLYQCRTNGTWTNTGIKVRNYISVVVSGNITIGDNGNWFSDGEDTGIPATPTVDEQLDNIITKHESLSRTVQGIAATGGASTANNVTYNNDSSRLNAENVQDAIDELQSSKIDKTSILQELGEAENKIMSQKAVKTELDKKANKADMVVELAKKANTEDVDVKLDKKFDKENVSQKSGNSEELVMSQKAVSDKLRDLDNKVSTQLPEIEEAKNEALNNIKENEQSAISNFNSKRVTPDMLSESTKQLIEASGGGTITNLPDDEDLTSVDDGTGSNVLKFADRTYNANNFSGKGYKILRKNIQSVNIASTKITITEVPSSDGTLSFTINGKDIQVSVSASTDNTTSLVAQKVASEVQKSMTEYEVSTNDSLVTITKIKPGSVAPSTFSSNNTGVICTISDDTKTELRNILTQNMVSSPNTIYEVRYDFTTIENIHLSDDSVFYINGGSVDSNYVYRQMDKFLSIDENSGVFNSAVVNADKTTINVNSIVNPKTNKIAINNAVVNFNNGYIDRKDKNGNDLDFNLGLYNGIFPIGRYRMFGNWRSNRLSYFRTIYTSEFIGLVKNNSLADIYEICIYKTLQENFKYDLIIDSSVIIDRTINLIKEINIIGNGGSALVKITINDPTVNVFEVNSTFEFTLYNKTITYKGSGNYTKNIMVKGIVIYGSLNACNVIFKLNTSTNLLLKDIKVGTHDNRFFNKILVCNIEGTKDADYTDFLILDNVSKNIITTVEDYDVNYADVVLGGGDCSTITNCSRTSFLIYGGQKYISNCMQSTIFACNCYLDLVNIHNEECNYYIDNSSVYFDNCLFMNAFNVTDSCMHINSGKVKEWVNKHVSSNLYATNNKNTNFLKLLFKNCRFMKTATSPLPLKVTNYDIKFYDKEDINKISLDNTTSGDRFNANNNITNISTNIKDLKGSKNINASILDKIKLVN